MLAFFGLVTVVTLLVLILTRAVSAMVALILVPLGLGLLAGLGANVGVYALSGVTGVSGTAAMLGFAVLYFGVMNDAGLFAPLILGIVRVSGSDPRLLVVGTAVVAVMAHLDGSGASTFLIAVPALLPVYDRLGLDRGVLACTVALAAGTMNMVPWGGPTLRAATSLQVDVGLVFRPLLPSLAVGVTGVLLVAIWLGHSERRRLAQVAPTDSTLPTRVIDGPVDEAQPPALLFGFNVLLTVSALVAMVFEWLPLPLVFMTAFAVALLVNHPSPQAQRDQLAKHGSHAMLMVALILAAGVFAGVTRESGMLAAMADALVDILPDGVGPHLPLVMAVTSMPLSLAFDPDSFYFGVLPVLAAASDAVGTPGIEVARAALLGQMTTGFPVSPLTPATFLLVGLSGVDLAAHQRRTIPWAFGVTLLMTVAAIVTSAFRW